MGAINFSGENYKNTLNRNYSKRRLRANLLCFYIVVVTTTIIIYVSERLLN